ncbi:MAG: hypothetical protein EOO39_42650 [Cytophagaceae bacterium]|nr:MAG: hypothetical protein EOO39_42650 [Cytophagaceae bacterium]
MKNFFLLGLLSLTTLTLFSNCTESGKANKADSTVKVTATGDTIVTANNNAPLDTALYDSLMVRMANGDTTGRWPVKKAAYPRSGAILPFKRVVAFYGNLFSKKMGILGEIPSDQMLAKLKGEAKAWEKADPKTPVVPATFDSTKRRTQAATRIDQRHNRFILPNQSNA